MSCVCKHGSAVYLLYILLSIFYWLMLANKQKKKNVRNFVRCGHKTLTNSSKMKNQWTKSGSACAQLYESQKRSGKYPNAVVFSRDLDVPYANSIQVLLMLKPFQIHTCKDTYFYEMFNFFFMKNVCPLNCTASSKTYSTSSLFMYWLEFLK